MTQDAKVCDIGPGVSDGRDAKLLTVLDARLKRKEFSLKTYKKLVSCMNMLRKITVESSAARAIVDEPLKLWNAIVKHYTQVYTRRNTVAYITSLLKYDQDLGTISTRTFWSKSLKLVSAPAAERRANNVLTKEKAETIPDLKKMEKVALALKDGASDTRVTSLEHLWMTVAAHVRAKRSDYGALLYIKHKKDISDKSQNFIILPKEGPATLFLREFKGSRYKPDFEEDLPDNVTEVLRQSLRDYPREYMFEGINAHGYEGHTKWQHDDSFASWAGKTMTKHMGEGHITLTGLRAAWVMKDTASGTTVTTAQRDAIAKSMMHSRNVQQTQYIYVNE